MNKTTPDSQHLQHDFRNNESQLLLMMSSVRRKKGGIELHGNCSHIYYHFSGAEIYSPEAMGFLLQTQENPKPGV
jgi:hypothetical protein